MSSNGVPSSSSGEEDKMDDPLQNQIWKEQEQSQQVEKEAPPSRRLSPLSLRLRLPPETHDEEYENSDSANDDLGTRISPLKRSAEDAAAFRPLKRQKGLLNGDYLNILNSDIQDAARGVTADDLTDDLGSSQLGMTFWSGAEKSIFFACLARLGRDDLPGIASRIGSKSVVEVKHYITLLDEENTVRAQTVRRQAVATCDYPAAVELSQQCCHVLDEAADTISIRQENREKQREEQKWGETWDLTPDIAKRLKDSPEDFSQLDSLPSLELFNLTNWLRLSQDIFMNSSIPASNWNHVDDVPPSIWATTFEDFRSLAISITRRLVQSSIYAASTRIRTTQEQRPTLKPLVRSRDVAVALASLGMEANSRAFWRKCARRNRLVVYDLEDDPEGGENPMAYEEVEKALLGPGDTVSDSDFRATSLSSEQEIETFSQDNSDADSEAGSEADSEDGEASIQPKIKGVDSAAEEEPEALQGLLVSEEEKQEIRKEAHEIFNYSVADFPETFRMKNALRSRIAMERQQERFAEACDQFASYNEEVDMWEMLQRAPPMEIPKVPDPGPPQYSLLDVEGMYPLGRDWRKNTQYKGQWESRVSEPEPS